MQGSRLCLSLSSFENLPSHESLLYELHLDRIKEVPPSWMQRVHKRFVLTLGVQGRSRALALQLLDNHPAFVDIDRTNEWISFEEVRARAPDATIIRSLHTKDASQFPPPDGEYIAKFVLETESPVEAMRLLLCAKRQERVIAFAMGEGVRFSRVLSVIAGAPLVYCYPDDGRPVAPGQLSLSEARERYRLESIGRNALCLGLLGGTVFQSPSDITHNRLLHFLDVEGVFVKIPIQKNELSDFLSLAREFGIHGLSVTIPHKLSVIPGLVTNTLTADNGGWLGKNTDGIGAKRALEKAGVHLFGRRVVILGAGGAARGIAQQFSQEGAAVHLVDRKSWDQRVELAKEADIVVNATPIGMVPKEEEMPLDPSQLSSHTAVLDCVAKPAKTRFLQRAEERGMIVVSGMEMYIEQAVEQFATWLPQYSYKELFRGLACTSE